MMAANVGKGLAVRRDVRMLPVIDEEVFREIVKRVAKPLDRIVADFLRFRNLPAKRQLPVSLALGDIVFPVCHMTAALE